MPKIKLEQWAEKNNVNPRTAQHWALRKRIPAKLEKVRVPVQMFRTQNKYMIDASTPVPE